MEKLLATFCGDEGCKWCPQVFMVQSEVGSRVFRIRDDFGDELTLSAPKFRALVEAVKSANV